MQAQTVKVCTIDFEETCPYCRRAFPGVVDLVADIEDLDKLIRKLQSKRRELAGGHL